MVMFRDSAICCVLFLGDSYLLKDDYVYFYGKNQVIYQCDEDFRPDKAFSIELLMYISGTGNSLTKCTFNEDFFCFYMIILHSMLNLQMKMYCYHIKIYRTKCTKKFQRSAPMKSY